MKCIKELLLKVVPMEGEDGDLLPSLHTQQDIEKFAELLVRECMDVALKQKKWVEDQKVFNDHDEQWNRARIQQSQHIVVKIREHFGVE